MNENTITLLNAFEKLILQYNLGKRYKPQLNSLLLMLLLLLLLLLLKLTLDPLDE